MCEMNKNRLGKFIEGNNSLAFWVAKDVIAGSLRYNPTYFYGETCTGKTLLLKSIKEELHRKYPEKTIIYWDSEIYVNTFTTSLREKNSSALYDWKRRNRSADVLIFDDFSFLLTGHKPASLQTFFQMLNELYLAQKQIIIAGHIPPRDMDINPRYRSRLSMGLVCGLEKPNEETRLEILKMDAARKGMQLNPEVMGYIASHVSNAGALSGALNRIAVMDSQELERLDVSKVKEMLSDLIVQEKRGLTISQIADVVTDYYKVSIDLLTGKSRSRDIVLMRYTLMYISMKKVPTVTYKEIGDFLEKDRTTVIYGVRSIERIMSNDEHLQLKKDIRNIIDVIDKIPL